MKIINFESKITIDDEADAAYLYLPNPSEKETINYTIPVIDERTWSMINIDISKNWKIIGLETLPSSLLNNLQA